MKFLTGGVCQ